MSTDDIIGFSVVGVLITALGAGVLNCWVFDELKAKRKLGLSDEGAIALGVLLTPFGGPFLAIVLAGLVLYALWTYVLVNVYRVAVGFYDLFIALLRPLHKFLNRRKTAVPKAKVVQR